MTKANFTSGIGGANTPSFEAYASSQTITHNTGTKVQFNNELFDTGSTYDHSTNYRFTPGITGKFYIYSQLFMQASSSTTFRDCKISLYKNGSEIKYEYWYFNNNPIRWIMPTLFTTQVVGSASDYYEIYIFTQTTDSANTTVYADSNKQNSIFGAFKIIE
jgi:hypothetical protein